MSVGKVCKQCGEDRQQKLYKKQCRGRLLTYRICMNCKSKNLAKWKIENAGRDREHDRLYAIKRRKRVKESIKDPKISAKIFLKTSRRTDRKKGRPHDLDLNFVESQMAKGCTYCGDTEIRMSLDRIDNLRGHTKDNVVPACIRCNYVRINMPYEAWLEFAPAMREAREKGAFGDWMSTIRGGRKSGADRGIRTLGSLGGNQAL